MLATVFTLLIVYELKHFVADFLLQGRYMLGKFKPGWDFLLPLSAHCGVHAGFTLLIVLRTNPSYWWLAIVDFVVHFIMDRIKASPKYLGRYKALSANEMIPIIQKAQVGVISDDDKKLVRNNGLFWWSLGLDQMVHNLTHLFIIFMLVKDMSEGPALVSIGLMLFMAPFFLIFSTIMLGVLVFLIYKWVRRTNRDWL